MKENEWIEAAYEAPNVEVLEVEVEQGFAVSGGDASGSGNGFIPG